MPHYYPDHYVEAIRQEALVDTNECSPMDAVQWMQARQGGGGLSTAS